MTVTEEQLYLHQIIARTKEGLNIEVEQYMNQLLRNMPERATKDVIANKMIDMALERIDEANPEWTFFASRIYAEQLYRQASHNRGYKTDKKYGDLFTLIKQLTDKGIYTPALLEKYSEEDIAYFGKQIAPERDQLFHYLALYTLATRYLATDHEKNTFELPQERWMMIAMHLMQDEAEEQRRELVLEAYWALSNLYMTVATPTLNNAGKTHGQLSSCFIDTVDDSLQSIYDVNTDVAQLSKNGGGIGVYMGKVRGRGSAIKGFKGMSSGVECSPLLA